MSTTSPPSPTLTSGPGPDQTALGTRPAPVTAGVARGGRYLVEVKVLTWRNLVKVWRTPQLLVGSIIQPLIFLVLFSQIFRSLADTPNFPEGVTYISYLLPGILVTTTASSGTQAAIGMANDLSTGIMDRFRSLPMHTSSVPLARSIYDVVRCLIQAVLMIALGYAVFDYRPNEGLLGTLGAVGIVLLFGFAMSWLFIGIGTTFRNAEAAQTIGFLFVFPLMFASSAYTPIASLPGWLQTIAKWNPMTHAIDAARGLALGGSTIGVDTTNEVMWTMATGGLLVAIGVFLTMRAFRRA